MTIKNLTVHQTLETLGIGLTKFYELLNTGYIKAIKIGKRTLVPQDSINAYLANLPSYPVKGGAGHDA